MMDPAKVPDTIYGQKHIKKGAAPKDRLGNELAVGDVIAYVLHHFQVSGSAIYVGQISKITPKGYIWATNIPLVTKEKSEEKKIGKPYEIIKLSDELMDQLVMKRLTLDATV